MALLVWYLIPIVRFLTCRLPAPPASGIWARVAGVVGRVEWAIAVVRDSVGLAVWVIVGAVHGGQVLGLWRVAVPPPLVIVALVSIVLSLVARRHHTRWRVQLLEYLLQHPAQHPQHFHDCYFRGFSWCAPVLPGTNVPLLNAETLDFRRGRAVQRRVWPLLHAAASTFFYSSLVLLAARTPSTRDRLREIVDAIMRVWGARLLDLSHVAVRVDGLQHLSDVDGTVIICSNHTSVLDFVVTPVVLGCAHVMRESLHIRFLVAKDHFLDNWFYYRGIRVGQAVEAAGMVFVHRRGTSEQRARAVPAAVRQMLEHHVDVAIYPHGTRTPARVDDAGRRTEPGYFTAGWPKRKRPAGQHLKKGAARLACQAALQSAQRSDGKPVYVVPVGIRGAGVTLPKGAMRVQTEGIIDVLIGEPICVQADVDNLDLFTDRLHEEIDQRLRALLDVDEKLLACFRDDVQQAAGDESANHVVGRLRQWTTARSTCLATLDLIYQHPAPQRALHLQRLRALLTTHDLSALDSFYRSL